MTKKSSLISVVIVIFGVIASVALLRFVEPPAEEAVPYTPTTQTTPKTQTPTTKEQTGATIKQPVTEIKERLNLAVPFTPQAPTANWDELHGEACEEASVIMAHAFFSGIRVEKLDPEYVEDEISKLTEWQMLNQDGRYLDQNSPEVAKMIEENYDLKTELVENITEEEIKQAINEHKLVIIAAAGRELGNPYFRAPGPPYHMFVIRGYNDDGFLTNDPGTRRGMNYMYTYKTIQNAQGEWDTTTHSVDQTKKIAIIVSK